MGTSTAPSGYWSLNITTIKVPGLRACVGRDDHFSSHVVMHTPCNLASLPNAMSLITDSLPPSTPISSVLTFPTRSYSLPDLQPKMHCSHITEQKMVHNRQDLGPFAGGPIRMMNPAGPHHVGPVCLLTAHMSCSIQHRALRQPHHNDLLTSASQ